MSARVLAVLLLMCSSASAAEWTAAGLVDRANELMRGQTSHGRMTMTVVTPRWERRLSLEIWNKGRKKALIRILEPSKERGIITLRSGSEMWNYLPSVERVIKIPPSLMMQSWMGSDFSNNDVVKSDSIVKEYTHRLISSAPAPGRVTYVIESIPTPDAPVVWGRVVTTVDVEGDDILPAKEEDFDERGRLMRVLVMDERKIMDGRRMPTRITCLPRTKPGYKTVIHHQAIQFNAALEDGFFSLGTVRRLSRE